MMYSRAHAYPFQSPPFKVTRERVAEELCIREMEIHDAERRRQRIADEIWYNDGKGRKLELHGQGQSAMAGPVSRLPTLVSPTTELRSTMSSDSLCLSTADDGLCISGSSIHILDPTAQLEQDLRSELEADVFPDTARSPITQRPTQKAAQQSTHTAIIKNSTSFSTIEIKPHEIQATSKPAAARSDGSKGVPSLHPTTGGIYTSDYNSENKTSANQQLPGVASNILNTVMPKASDSQDDRSLSLPVPAPTEQTLQSDTKNTAIADINGNDTPSITTLAPIEADYSDTVLVRSGRQTLMPMVELKAAPIAQTSLTSTQHNTQYDSCNNTNILHSTSHGGLTEQPVGNIVEVALPPKPIEAATKADAVVTTQKSDNSTTATNNIIANTITLEYIESALSTLLQRVLPPPGIASARAEAVVVPQPSIQSDALTLPQESKMLTQQTFTTSNARSECVADETARVQAPQGTEPQNAARTRAKLVDDEPLPIQTSKAVMVRSPIDWASSMTGGRVPEPERSRPASAMSGRAFSGFESIHLHAGEMSAASASDSPAAQAPLDAPDSKQRERKLVLVQLDEGEAQRAASQSEACQSSEEFSRTNADMLQPHSHQGTPGNICTVSDVFTCDVVPSILPPVPSLATMNNDYVNETKVNQAVAQSSYFAIKSKRELRNCHYPGNTVISSSLPPSPMPSLAQYAWPIPWPAPMPQHAQGAVPSVPAIAHHCSPQPAACAPVDWPPLRAASPRSRLQSGYLLKVNRNVDTPSDVMLADVIRTYSPPKHREASPAPHPARSPRRHGRLTRSASNSSTPVSGARMSTSHTPPTRDLPASTDAWAKLAAVYREAEALNLMLLRHRLQTS